MLEEFVFETLKHCLVVFTLWIRTPPSLKDGAVSGAHPLALVSNVP